jgi:NADPH:quinone reductase-like Zn-dependent oxidoreductase
MKAALRDRYGGPDVVSVRDVERPEPGDGEVLVRVVAASVNRGDLDALYPRWSFIRLGYGLRAPRASARHVGIDVAGVVEALGEGVTTLDVGDRVFSDLSVAAGRATGAFAEYVRAPAEALARVPEGWSFEDAACLPHSAIIAIHAFRPRGDRRLKGGDRVMVVGASGNVGPFVIQLAKSGGAHVTGVASGDKLDFVRSLGADEVIDYRTTDYTRPAQRYDWIVDVNAHHPLRRWVAALNPGGVYVCYAGSTWWLLSSAFLGPLLSRVTGKRLGLGFIPPFRPDYVAELKKLAEDGVFRPVIDRRFALDDVVAALRYVDEGKASGKVIVAP